MGLIGVGLCFALFGFLLFPFEFQAVGVFMRLRIVFKAVVLAWFLLLILRPLSHGLRRPDAPKRFYRESISVTQVTAPKQ